MLNRAPLTLTCGPMRLEITAAYGGAISALRYRDTDILRPLPAGQTAANQASSFPLVPFSNRIAYAQCRVDDALVQLTPNFDGHAHVIHGNGWQSCWQVEQASQTNAVLTFEHDALSAAKLGAWPWPFKATQYFTLTADSLHLSLSIQNNADHPTPVGLGFHPYFADAAEALLQMQTNGVWLNSEEMLPFAHTPVPEQWDYTQAQAARLGSVDNCFTGWQGSARIIWPKKGLQAELSAPDVSHVVLFIPPVEKNFIAVEPVSHVNNAINLWPDQQTEGAMQRLVAGDVFTLNMQIKVTPYV
ncbi:MAG: aldose 1-epimerase [Plesiomonas sp.]